MSLGRKSYKIFHQNIYRKAQHLRGSNFLLRNLRRLSYPGDFTEVEYNGLNVKIDPNTYVGEKIYRGEAYEDSIVNYVKDNLEEDDCIIDVGAHIGILTLVFGKNCPEGKVFAFEPDEDNRTLLEDNIELNNLDNIEVREKALSNFEGKESFSHFDDNAGMSKIDEEGDLSVETTTLSQFLEDEGIKHVDLIKMDIEGAELEAIKGLEDSISRVNEIILEIHGAVLTEDEIEELKSILGRHGSLELLEEVYEENEIYIWRNSS